MDYIEILNFCGYDVDKAHEMAKRNGAIPFSEAIKKTRKPDEQEETPCISIITLIPSGATVLVIAL